METLGSKEVYVNPWMAAVAEQKLLDASAYDHAVLDVIGRSAADTVVSLEHLLASEGLGD